ncbi:MAG: UbiA family prenyltransferase [Chloroflexi bacterium]|nr:UbiA family prenyltransferase [Chloroflexota bacterium]
MPTSAATGPKALPEALREILTRRQPANETRDGASPAAVLVPLQHHDGRWHVILNVRSETVGEHRGEVAFPGGRLEPADAGMVACALRETWEEMGIRPQDVDVLGPLDAVMTRTRARPLPSGRLRPGEALAFGWALLVVGLAYLGLTVGWLPSVLTAASAAAYILAYTPLKTRSYLATLVGAVPGAFPALIGWSAATGTVEFGAVILFCIAFLWQLPHVLALAWLLREDYTRVGFFLSPPSDPEGRRIGRHMVYHSVSLLAISGLPTFLGLTGQIYLVGAFVSAAIVHLLATMVFKGEGEFIDFFRPYSLAYVLTGVTVIPILNMVLGLIAGLWLLAVAVICVERNYSLDRPQAIATVAIPMVTLLVLAMMMFAVLGVALFLGLR